MDKCEYCGSELECLGGQPAHKSNWVCTNGWCKKPTVIRGDEVKSSSAPTCYRDKIVDRLIDCYNRNSVEVAEYLDTRIDRSGNLLGWLREEARKSR